MKNFVQRGKVLDFVVPSGGVVSGQALLVGGVFGISCGDYAAGVTGELQVEGVFDIAMDGSTPTQFQAAYWDNTAKLVTTTTTSNTKIGVFTAAGASPTGGAGFGQVRLNPSF